MDQGQELQRIRLSCHHFWPQNQPPQLGHRRTMLSDQVPSAAARIQPWEVLRQVHTVSLIVQVMLLPVCMLGNVHSMVMAVLPQQPLQLSNVHTMGCLELLMTCTRHTLEDRLLRKLLSSTDTMPNSDKRNNRVLLSSARVAQPSRRLQLFRRRRCRTCKRAHRS